MFKKIYSNLTKIIILLLLFLLLILTSSISYVTAVNQNISDSVFRLHIIANSDSVEDQNLKYKVRDNIISYIKDMNFSSKNDVASYMTSNQDLLKKIAKDTIIQNGYDYNVNISIGNFHFPTKYYGDISLPTGNYDALKIEIGNAIGQNWWCVMFPPLCFVDVTSGIVPDESKEYLEENLDLEEYQLISTSTADSDIEVKFKIVEIINSIINN